MRKVRSFGGLIVLAAIAGTALAGFLLALAYEFLVAVKDTTGTALPSMARFVRTEDLFALLLLIVTGCGAYLRRMRPRRHLRAVEHGHYLHRERTAA